ncbi:hypothetical protein V6N13_074669 [Hibiscus sabdariffa]|uniref:Uncharacterized protein n=1 Tax=Hibiscus sabdariffa TaxID=183260 RepID=A0ABR2U9E7_9ROSI
MAISNEPQLAATTVPLGTTVEPLAFDSNVGHPSDTHGLGVNMALHVAPISFIGLEGFIDFLATLIGSDPISENAYPYTPAETNNDAPLIFENMDMNVTSTILPTNLVGELDNDMGKYFLTTSSMLFVFYEWLSKAFSPPTTTNDKKALALISRGAKRRSSMQDDNKLKKPRTPPISSKTRAGMSNIKHSSVEVDL